MKRIIKGFVLLVLVAGVAAAVGLGHYVLTGGSLSELPQRIRITLQNPIPELSRMFDASKESAVQTAQKAAQEATTGIAQKAAQAATEEAANSLPAMAADALKNLSIPSLDLGPKPAASPEPAPAPVEAQQDIEIFFAPCDRAERHGIDEAFLGFLQSAKTAIYGAFYDLQLQDVADVLVAKRKEGVDVRIVSDSDYAKREAIQACVQAGIKVVFDDRGAFMHNKFCVVDHERVWTGSTNITENCMFKNNNNAVMVNCKPLASDFEVEFGEMHSLHRFGKGSKYATPCPTVTVGETRIECYFAPDDQVAQEIIQEIECAGQSIDVMAFSFTSRDIAQAIGTRARQGVAVRALFEKQQAGSQYSQDEFLSGQGARVYLDNNDNNMHNKIVVVDEATVITGSYNFSNNAEKNNDENVLIIHSPEIAQKYTAEFERLILD